MSGPVTIDVHSDISCPWCFIGSRRLRRVLGEKLPELRAHVRHHPFQLHPQAPAGGIDIHAQLRERYGADPAALFERVEEAARDEGIELDLSLQPRAFDTAAAHTLIRHAATLGTQSELVDAFFVAYFLKARDVSDPDVLVETAVPHGFSEEQVRGLINDSAELGLTRMEAADAARRGVRGVPFFVLGGKYALSGAQPDEVLEGAIRRAAEEESEESAA